VVHSREKPPGEDGAQPERAGLNKIGLSPCDDPKDHGAAHESATAIGPADYV